MNLRATVDHGARSSVGSARFMASKFKANFQEIQLQIVPLNL
jgi:hypothetical protein